MFLWIAYLLKTFFFSMFSPPTSTPTPTPATEEEDIVSIRRLHSLYYEGNMRMCCPLSFCGSLEHITIQDCDHPDKLLFVEPLHIMILTDIQDKIDVLRFRVISTEEKEQMVEATMAEIQRKYLSNPVALNEEQLHILLFRLKIPVVQYWNVSYEDRIQQVLNVYCRTMRFWMEPNAVTTEEENVLYPETLSQPPLLLNEEMPDLASLDRVFENEDNLLFLDYTFVGPFTPTPPYTGMRTVYKGEPDAAMKAEECPICYETACFVKTGCGHSFCDCLVTYIIQKTRIPEPVPCPCCRQEIMELQVYNWTTHHKF